MNKKQKLGLGIGLLLLARAQSNSRKYIEEYQDECQKILYDEFETAYMDGRPLDGLKEADTNKLVFPAKVRLVEKVTNSYLLAGLVIGVAVRGL